RGGVAASASRSEEARSATRAGEAGVGVVTVQGHSSNRSRHGGTDVSKKRITETSVRNGLEPATRGIYAIVCPETGDVVYIGQSVNIERRFAAHMAGAGGGGLGLAKRRWVLELRNRG